MNMTTILKKAGTCFLALTMALGISSVGPTQIVKADEVSATGSTTQERKVIAYFAEWAFGNDSHENYTADRMPWEKMTHINYAFATVNPSTNKIDFGDKNAAIEKEFPGQTSDFSYKGHFNVINSYKKKYPNVKSLISVGGWAGTTGFYTMTDTAAGRETFANSCVEFIKQYGFDGVDIDYEYPTSTQQAGNPDDSTVSESRRSVLYANYIELMKTLREKLDAAGATDNKHYLLTAALPASSWILGGMGIGEYAQYLDYANLMTYDYHGAWNGHVGPQSALYPDERDTETKLFAMPILNIDWAYRYFSGVLSPEKINIGVPYYTRGWKDVQKGTLPGGLWGSAATSGGGAIGEDNLWHDLDANGKEIPGGTNPLWHAKNLLENSNYEYFFDDVTKTPYIWNEEKKVFLTYEDETSLKAKVDYVVDKGLGGIMIWEIDGDYDLNPNYVQGGTESKYVIGDTLTTYVYDELHKAGELVVPEKPGNTLPVKDYKIEFTGKYDHPNYSYTMSIVNNTGEPIEKGWVLEFDLPNSCYLESAWGLTMEKLGVSEDGSSTRYRLTGPGWADIPTGGKYDAQGNIKLCFTGGPQNFTLNGFVSQDEITK